MNKRFPHLSQPDQMDCGATCLTMIAKHYGKNYTIQNLRESCSATRAGVSLFNIGDAAEKLGFKTLRVKVPFKKLAEDAPLPCIVHWKQEHFVVVYDIRDKRDSRDKRDDEDLSRVTSVTRHETKRKGYVRVADPAPLPLFPDEVKFRINQIEKQINIDRKTGQFLKSHQRT